MVSIYLMDLISRDLVKIGIVKLRDADHSIRDNNISLGFSKIESLRSVSLILKAPTYSYQNYWIWWERRRCKAPMEVTESAEAKRGIKHEKITVDHSKTAIKWLWTSHRYMIKEMAEDNIKTSALSNPDDKKQAVERKKTRVGASGYGKKGSTTKATYCWFSQVVVGWTHFWWWLYQKL